MKRANLNNANHQRPRMHLSGMLTEAWRNLASGTTHACAFAVTLATMILLLCGVDLLTIMQIEHQTDEFVASGGSTTIIDYPKRIDPVACESLASLQGVHAAGAIRQADSGKITFAVLPSTGVPSYEATPGAIRLLADSTTGTGNRPTLSGNSALADGLWLSSEAASPLKAQPKEKISLKDGRTAIIGGIYKWPNDGRKSGFSYAAVSMVPVNRNERFDSCWVKAWPIPDHIESLLQLTAVSEGEDDQERPVISQLNTSQGSQLDAETLYRQRLTTWAPVVALAGGLLIGIVAIRMRRLELASTLHCGVPKTVMLTQMATETTIWIMGAAVLCSPLLAWVWIDHADSDALAITNTLLRIPVAAGIGALLGAVLAALSVQERHLFRYFKSS